MYKLYIPVIFFILCFYHSLAESCTYKDTCQCQFQNRSVIDLRSLGYHGRPRWQNLKPTDEKENFTYSYNPCFSFKMGLANQPCAKGVAVCQYDEFSKTYENCGDSDSVNFVMQNNKLRLIYSTSKRSTYINLVCSEDAVEPTLVVKGKTKNYTYASQFVFILVGVLLFLPSKEEKIFNPSKSIEYCSQFYGVEMTLISRCACPDLCQLSHLSIGSVLVIIFMIFVVLYLVLGIVHSSLTRGAYGWELIPHYEFWADFPLLVRDGCVFVVSGCKAETAYERI